MFLHEDLRLQIAFRDTVEIDRFFDAAGNSWELLTHRQLHQCLVQVRTQAGLTAPSFEYFQAFFMKDLKTEHFRYLVRRAMSA